jgi:hypothetical protein
MFRGALKSIFLDQLENLKRRLHHFRTSSDCPPLRVWKAVATMAAREENFGAQKIELTADDQSDIDGATSKITVQGARYS